MASLAMISPGTQAGASPSSILQLVKIAEFRGLRVLCWKDRELYASRGYSLLKAETGEDGVVDWRAAGRFHPGIRCLTASSRLTSRLFRDGFHSLAVLSSGNIVGAIPGRIVTLARGEMEFRVTHRLLRGTRPLHIASAPNGHLVWGEYFDNRQRDEVYIYGSTDGGMRWDVAYTFPKGQIRHVHNIVYDEWEKCYWVLTGDVAKECRIMRATLDFAQIETVVSGTQQTRSAALLPAQEGVYWSTDSPSEPNHIYFLDRKGTLTIVADIGSSSTYGCHVGNSLFFSTMVEPSQVNPARNVCLFGGTLGGNWQSLMQWKKDVWPMKFFQYGNAFLPDGANPTDVLAVSTVAVSSADLTTTLFRVTRR